MSFSSFWGGSHGRGINHLHAGESRGSELQDLLGVKKPAQLLHLLSGPGQEHEDIKANALGADAEFPPLNSLQSSISNPQEDSFQPFPAHVEYILYFIGSPQISCWCQSAWSLISTTASGERGSNPMHPTYLSQAHTHPESAPINKQQQAAAYWQGSPLT